MHPSHEDRFFARASAETIAARREEGSKRDFILRIIRKSIVGGNEQGERGAAANSAATDPVNFTFPESRYRGVCRAVFLERKRRF